MERSLKRYDKECMKMALLKHEETFRQQVHELHRLYQVQKLLMRDMNMELKRRVKPRNSENNLYTWQLANETVQVQPYCSYQDQSTHYQKFHLKVPTDEYIGNNTRDTMVENKCEANLELTLAIGSSQRKREGTPYTSESGASFSSSSAESGVLKLNGDGWGLFRVPELSTGFQGESKSKFDVEEQSRQDRIEQHPWFFQCLSSNMT